MSGVPYNTSSRGIHVIDKEDDTPCIISHSNHYLDLQNRAANLYHNGVSRINRFIREDVSPIISQSAEGSDNNGRNNFGRNLAGIILGITIAYLVIALIITAAVSVLAPKEHVDATLDNKAKKTSTNVQPTKPSSRYKQVYFKDILGNFSSFIKNNKISCFTINF